VTPVTHAPTNNKAKPSTTTAENDRVDDHLGLRSGVVLIVDAERVRALVDQRPHTRVPGSVLIDDDSPAREIAPAASRPSDHLVRDRVPQRFSKRLQRREQVRVRVAGQRLTRRAQDHWLYARKRLGLGELEHKRRLEKHAQLIAVLALPLPLFHGHWREDPQRGLAPADTAPEVQPRPKTRNMLRLNAALVTLQRQQHAVPGRIRAEACADTHPPSPPLRAQQLLGRSLQPLTIGATPLVPL